MTLARELIHAVKECGADIAKFQLYDAKALFPVEGNPWYDYNCSTELSRAQLCMLAEEARRSASSSWPPRLIWSALTGCKRRQLR